MLPRPVGAYSSASRLAWNGLAPPRVEGFVWFTLKGKILTRLKLKRWGLLRDGEDLSCPLCRHLEEDIDHLFIRCPIAREFKMWVKFVSLF